MLEVLARTSLGTLQESMGHLHEAEAIFQEALQAAIRSDSPVAGQAYNCLSHVHLEWNNMASTKLLTETQLDSSAQLGAMEALAYGHMLMATVLQVQNDIPGANLALAEASRLMHEHPLEVRSAIVAGSHTGEVVVGPGQAG